MQKILLLIAVLFLSTACGKKTKSALGLTQTMPDEYQVKRNKALEIPPHYGPAGPIERGSQVKAKGARGKKENFSKSEEALLEKIE